MSTITVTHFTDPMMGLSWECEPMLRRVEARFGTQVAFRNAMGLLVRDVADFMTPEERALPEAEGPAQYNARLAQIYLQEEPLAGMPINMDGFSLFAPDRRTSLPLCLAYEAVTAARPRLAATFLYRLRFATMVECRPTTKLDELTRVVQLFGIEEQGFLAAYHSSAAQDHLYRDLAFKDRLGIFGLPAFVISCGEKAALLSGVPSYQQLERAIVQVSEDTAQPHAPQATPEALRRLLAAHPLISLVEVAAAFGLPGLEAARSLTKPLLAAGEAHLIDAPKGQFLAPAPAPDVCMPAD